MAPSWQVVQRSSSRRVAFGGPSPVVTTVWNVLKIGAGGQITKIDIAADGTKVIATDTYGCYWWDKNAPSPGNGGGLGTWVQLVTLTSMPAGEGTLLTSPSWTGSGPGVFDIVIAPSNTQRFYMMFNDYVYRTDNRGTTWIRTAFVQSTTANDANKSPKLFGHFMAVDPANADVIYVGQVSASASVSTGVSVSVDGGATWNTVPGIVAPSGSGGVLVAFDKSAGTQGSGSTLRTKNIYASSYGTGAYFSGNGGASFALTAAGRPPTHRHMKVPGNGGVVWFIDNSGGPTAAWTYNGTTWANITTANSGGNSLRSADIDPANSSRVVLLVDSGEILVSTNGGASWGAKSIVSRAATDIPWMQATNGDFLGAVDIVFDQTGSNLAFTPGGIGVWTVNPINGGGTTTYTSQSAGIEQLVSNQATSPPGGKPVLSFLDKPIFYVNDPNVYPSNHGITQNNNLMEGYSVDYASSNPGTVVALVQNLFGTGSESASSPDGGQTWNIFANAPQELINFPATNLGGSIAALSPTNILIQVSGCGSLYNTKDGGLTWNQLTIAGVTNDCGWSFANFLDRQNIAADRVDADTCYAFNDGVSTPAIGGIYKSVNKGDTWTRVSTTTFDANAHFNAKMRAVPGNAGHLFFTSGQASPGPYPHTQFFYRSILHGSETPWPTVPNVKEVFAYGFGKAKPGGIGYPTIFIVGWVTVLGVDTYGIWRSDDNCSSWIKISDGYPLGSVDQIKWIEGDANIYGMVYVGFAGSGFAYGKLQ